jgi:hypothetical protein
VHLLTLIKEHSRQHTEKILPELKNKNSKEQKKASLKLDKDEGNYIEGMRRKKLTIWAETAGPQCASRVSLGRHERRSPTSALAPSAVEVHANGRVRPKAGISLESEL